MGRLFWFVVISSLLTACHEEAPKGKAFSSLNQDEKSIYSILAQEGRIDTIITKKGDTLLNIKRGRIEPLIEPLEGGGSGIVTRKDGKRPKKMCVSSDDTLKTDSSASK